MRLPDLPDDILANIIKRVCDDEFYNLKPFIRVGKRSKDLVFREDVLKSAAIYSLCYDPYNTMEGEPGFWNEGRGRNFMLKCFQHGNPEAIYFEGLRLGVERADLRTAISILRLNSAACPCSLLAISIFFVLLGEPEESIQYFEAVFANHAPDGSTKLIEIGEGLNSDIQRYNVSYVGHFSDTFKYPDCDSVNTPYCVFDHDPDFEFWCAHCYLYWCARNISYMI